MKDVAVLSVQASWFRRVGPIGGEWLWREVLHYGGQFFVIEDDVGMLGTIGRRGRCEGTCHAARVEDEHGVDESVVGQLARLGKRRDAEFGQQGLRMVRMSGEKRMRVSHKRVARVAVVEELRTPDDRVVERRVIRRGVDCQPQRGGRGRIRVGWW